MIHTFTIESGQDLPTTQELINILATTERVAIHYSVLPDDYVYALAYAFPDKAVRERKWDKTIFICPSINNDLILQKKETLYECAKAFRKDANDLMQLMADKFDINLQTLEGLFELKFKKSNKQRGKLNEDWNYFFHGAECQFENIATRQIVEVIITTRPEFGYLDCYFFYNYMATTEQFKSLAAFFNNDYLHICKAIDLLVLEGVLTRVKDIYSERNVIAL